MATRGCSCTRFVFYLILLLGLYTLGDTSLEASEWLKKYMELLKNASAEAPFSTSSATALVEEAGEEEKSQDPDPPAEQGAPVAEIPNEPSDEVVRQDQVATSTASTTASQSASPTPSPTASPTEPPTTSPKTSPTTLPTTSTATSDPKHYLFVGDSTLRYALLEMLHEHYHPPGFPTPDALIHEKRHDSWTAFFDYSTNHFSGAMTCDCQRSEVWNLGSEIENRYYKHKDLMVTFLQGYGDNMAHGRYWPPTEVWNATITLPSDANYTHPVLEKSDRGMSWGYMGEDWDRLLSEYASKFDPAPKAVVMGAGLWPNSRITIRMGYILREALKVGSMVVWRGVLKNRDQKEVIPSEADVAVQEWQYRLPNIIYQPFPSSRIVTNESDYFDLNHFSLPWVYHEWNKELKDALWGERTMQRVAFLLEGDDDGDRSYETKLIRQLCAPPLCTSYIFTSSEEWPGLTNWTQGYSSVHKGSCKGEEENLRACWGKLLFNLQFEALVVFNTKLRWFFPAPTLKFFQDLNSSTVWAHESYANSENGDEVVIMTDRSAIFEYLYNNTVRQKTSIPMGAVLPDDEGSLDCSVLDHSNHSVLPFSCQLHLYEMNEQYGQPWKWTHRNERTFCLGHDEATRMIVNRTCSSNATDQIFVGTFNEQHSFGGNQLLLNLTVPQWFSERESQLFWYKVPVEVYSSSMIRSLQPGSDGRRQS